VDFSKYNNLEEARHIYDESKIEGIKYLRRVNPGLGLIEARCALDPDYRAIQAQREKDKLAIEMFDDLVAALEDRMLHCSCHYGGLDPDGFADQPCPECDRDRALLKKCKGVSK